MSVFRQVCITATFLLLTVNGDKSSSPAFTKLYDQMMACNPICNIIQDSDSEETKLPTYWNTPFPKICLGMKISPGQELVFSEIMKKTAQALILESTLEREDTMMTIEHTKVLMSSK